MSFLGSRKGEPLFVVQSGVVAWEDPQPIVDWRWTTVSVVSRSLSVAIALLWTLVASRPRRFDRVLRFYIAPMSPSMTAAQKRRLITGLKTGPSGFSETNLSIVDNHACVTSVLSDPSAVDSGCLTMYRRCALVELEESAVSRAEPLKSVCRTAADLGGTGICTLLNIVESSAVLRVLELESHAAIQLVGPSEVCNPAIQCLADRSIRQFHDVRTLPEEIANLRK
jgi:hypothetical protein